jgi:hypothetical protein
MTWTNRVVRIALAVGVVGALALASGANMVESWLWWLFW